MFELLFLYLLIINLISFLLMYIDKRKAIKGKWRIKEKNLLLVSLIGGSFGSLLGMYTFRHKTKTKIFYMGVPLLLGVNILTILYFLSK